MIKLRTIAWIGGLTAVAVTVAVYCVFSTAERRWDEWSRRTDTLQEQLRTADTRRPVLWGTATPGDAWTAYATAIALAIADEKLEVQVRPSERVRLDPPLLARLLDAHAETLAQLSRGAHCQDAREPIDWSRGFSNSAHSLLAMRGLSNLAVTQALAQIEQGQPVAAVDTLLDAAQLGRDLMHSHLLINEMIGEAIVFIPTCEAVQMNNLLDRLSPAALDRFADGLTILGRHIGKVGPSLHGEAVLFARTAQNHPQLFEEAGLSTGQWRYGFSTRLMFADAGLHMMDLADRTAAAAQEPWSVFDTYLSGVERNLLDAHNPVLSTVPRGVLLSRIRTIARLRLLRMAIEHRRGRPIPQLVDPFGDTLQHNVDADGKARFWSIGPDGSRNLFLFRLSGS